MALKDLVVVGRQADDAGVLGQRELEAGGDAEALGAKGLDERSGIDVKRQLADAEILEVIVERKDFISMDERRMTPGYLGSASWKRLATRKRSARRASMNAAGSMSNDSSPMPSSSR